jgi:hypothetical protein
VTTPEIELEFHHNPSRDLGCTADHNIVNFPCDDSEFVHRLSLEVNKDILVRGGILLVPMLASHLQHDLVSEVEADSIVGVAMRRAEGRTEHLLDQWTRQWGLLRTMTEPID